ncbi:MAG: RNA methyltransferase [Armatimonadetes bacterium]|nr:RNA methyltransferase [Armatimonadota bacterium]
MAMEEIDGIKHPAYKHALSLTRPAERMQSGLYLVETANFVRQALASPEEVLSVFATRDEASSFSEECAARDIPLYIASAGLIQKLVGTSYEVAVTAICVVRQRRVALESLGGKQTVILAGEEIQDPRNVGVLVRTAEAVGCAALILSANSAEAYSRPAVRSSTGSILRLPVCLVPDLPTALRSLRQRGFHVVASSARAPRTVYDGALSRRPLVVVVGNETNGMTEAARAEASEFVSLPMASGGPSSLNVTVAAGVLLYEALRQARAVREPGETQ